MNEKPNDTAYQIASRTAVVAGVFVVVICALLLYDYSRRLVKDPLDSAAYKALVAALDQQPTNESLKQQIRELDLQLGREYFRQRAFSHVGAGLLLLFVVVFLAAAKWSATLRRRLPSPRVQAASEDREAAWTGIARWAVVALCLVLVGVAVALSVNMRSELPVDREEFAAVSGPSVEPASADQPSVGSQKEVAGGGSGRDVAPTDRSPTEVTSPVPKAEATVASTAPAASEPPPSDEEVGKMWASFRGPGGLGVSAYTDIPDAWDGNSDKAIAWKTPVPLPGNSSPVVWGNRVFLSGADKSRREVYCFDAGSGKLLWQQAVPGTPQSTARPPKVNEETGYASPTMATDGRRAFAMFANGDLAAFDFAGKLVWSKSLGMPENAYGHASSLAMYKNLVLVQFDQGEPRKPKSKLLAFDSATGNVAWQVDRPVPNSWASPIVIRHAERDQVITAADPWVIAYNPADGAELWRAKCLRTDIGPSPAFAEGRVFVANDNSELSAIRADGQGDVTATNVLWKGEDGMPDTCSPLATKEFVFLLTSFGTLTCYDAEKGEMLWAEDFSADFNSSPALVGNRLYLVDKTGQTWVVEPTREKCNRLGESELGENCVTSPAFQDGRIYLRGKDHLFCIKK